MKKTLILYFFCVYVLNIEAQNKIAPQKFSATADYMDLCWSSNQNSISFTGNQISQKTNYQINESIKIKIENTIDIWRKDEVIELDWALLFKKNQAILSSAFVVENTLTNKQLEYQLIKDTANKPFKLLVQLSLAPISVQYITIKKGIPETFKTKTFGRYVPERKDDFAWENDKIAFRMYGPALQATGEISSGIDVWVKSTPEMIIDKWYKLDDYHVDHGEGMDCYKVGPTLGAGGIAPYDNGKLYYSKNWASYKVHTTGNLRTVFELSYLPWQFNGIEISGTYRITLNAGSQLNEIEVIYNAKKMDTIPVAIGIIKRKEKGTIVLNEKDGYISYWEASSKKFGTTGVGIVVHENDGLSIIENHMVVLTKAINKKPLKYYQGACWDRAGELETEIEWSKYLKEFSMKIKNPLIVTLE